MNEMKYEAGSRPTSATRLASFVARLDQAGLPSTVRRKLLANLADTLGVVAGARGMPHVEQMLAATRAMDGPPRASVLGHGFATSETEAAFANGFMAHAYDFDDASKFVHPGCTVIPAVLALGEARGVSGAELVSAIAAGYEVAVRVGLAAGPEHRKRAFHPTGTCGVFGAAAGSARVLGLSPRQTESALGLAGSFAAGITRYRRDGSANKHVHAGLAARNGVTAALLAEQNLNGSSDIFEGEMGFLAVYADGGAPEPLTRRLGQEFLLTDADIKPYPSCRQTHGAVDLALDVAAELKGRIDEIERVEIAVYTYAAQDWYARSDVPGSWLEAVLRIPYCVAACLRFGRMDMDVFSDTSRADPTLRRLVDRITVRGDQALDHNWPQERPVRLSIHMADGTTIRRELRKPSGSEGQELSDGFLFGKFRSLLERSFSDRSAREAYDQVLALPDAPALDDVLKHFR